MSFTDYTQSLFIDRAALSNVFHDPRTLLAFEGIQRVVLETTPQAVDQAQQTADDAAAQAAAAQEQVTTVSGAQFLVLALSTALTSERLLQGDTGVTINTATANIAKIVVDALAILNTAPISFTQPLTANFAVDVQSSLRCDSLRIDQAPAASVTAANFALPINLNGTTYYVKLSSTP